MKIYNLIIIAVLTSLSFANTLNAVKTRGYLKCGMSTGLVGFSSLNNKGEWEGLDVETCKAVALAVFNDTQKIQYIPLTAKDRFISLQSGEIDVLNRNTAYTFTRDVSNGFNFVAIDFYDQQGLMFKKGKIQQLNDLNGATICMETGTTTISNLTSYFKSKNIKYTPLLFDNVNLVNQNYEAGVCDAVSADASKLSSQRASLKNPSEHTLFTNGEISKEALGIVVRQGDDEWADIVRWSFFTLVLAEEFGITKNNIDSVKQNTNNQSIKRLLGLAPNQSESLKLDKDFAYRIIKNLGNYGEIYERTVGLKSPLMNSRGLNELYTKGGLLYAPPFQ